METMDASHPTVLALASEFKGTAYLNAARDLGARVVLLTNTDILDEPWPEVAEQFDMPDIHHVPELLNAVSYLARERRFDRVVALDDFDVGPAAALREHLQLPGMDASTARRFRDKLAMRIQAQRAGLAAPDFVGLFERSAIADFMARVPAPWMLKPRTLAGSEGIRKLQHPDELWRALDDLGDEQSHYLLERFVAGDVFHVDALLWRSEVVFAQVSRYGTPPMTALQGRGIFTTRTLPPEDADAVELRRLATTVVTALGRESGPTHTEFIRGQEGFVFLETSARVGGGNIDLLVESASGVALWGEAARIDLAEHRSEDYRPPQPLGRYAGLIACPAPAGSDTAAYTDPEIIHRPTPNEFVSLVVAADEHQRVEELLDRYSERFARDFL
jgi:biotin carboxylase